MVKEKCFVKPGGISITLKENDYGEIGENYIYSSLFSNKFFSKKFKPKRHYYVVFVVTSCSDIESQPGPYRNIPELKGYVHKKD